MVDTVVYRFIKALFLLFTDYNVLSFTAHYSCDANRRLERRQLKCLFSNLKNVMFGNVAFFFGMEGVRHFESTSKRDLWFSTTNTQWCRTDRELGILKKKNDISVFFHSTSRSFRTCQERAGLKIMQEPEDPLFYVTCHVLVKSDSRLKLRENEKAMSLVRDENGGAHNPYDSIEKKTGLISVPSPSPTAPLVIEPKAEKIGFKFDKLFHRSRNKQNINRNDMLCESFNKQQEQIATKRRPTKSGSEIPTLRTIKICSAPF